MQAVKWGEYRLGDLFEIENTLSFNTDRLVSGNEYDYVTRTSLNQGILQSTGFVNEENINPAGTWSLGLLQMDFFYRNKPWYAGQFVRRIVPKISIPECAILFFQTLLNRQKPILLQVLVRNVDKTFRNIAVQLPTTADNKIDFDFMESFIRELEEERVRELAAYLTASGLADTTLTASEQAALNAFDTLEWGEFRIGELFDILSYKKRFDANKTTLVENCGHPYIVRTALNNGQKGFIDEDESYLNEGNTISFGQDTATMFYQETPYFTGDKIKIMKSLSSDFNKKNAMYLISAMSRVFSSFSWGASSFSIETIKSQIVSLPAKNWNIDYKFMETFISAVQKLVIKDVVLYADKKISTTRKIVGELDIVFEEKK